MTPDILVKKIEALGRLCQQLHHALASFETVIDRENDAIRRSDINELERITQEKSAFGLAVEDKAARIRKAIDELAGCLEWTPNPDQPTQLEDILVQLQKNRSELTEAAMDRLAEQIAGLTTERQRLFPKIESNSYLVKKLLQYHRETYAFWQAVAHESEAVYGKTGKAVAAPKKSILTVRT